ncbi:flagellar hook-length control protein FliK [Variovorax sp. 160MFSha2.1]|uniref:flagellar hook-length control protein FliK n=1 Tax=Variovorax sp. 160MFSha2.1 TaxID=3158367 RepID=UPI003AAF1FCC
MPSMIMPPVTTNAAAQPAAAQAASRGRGADEAQGPSFGAALERSRANGGGQAGTAEKDGSTSDVAAIDRKAARKPGADEDTKKEDAPLADPNLAFLAQANSPLHALTLAGRSAAQAAGEGTADGLAKTTPADATTDVALDPALQALSAKTAAGTAAVAADAADTAEAAAKAAKEAVAQKPAAAAAQAAPLQADAAPAGSLHDAARAAIAAQTMAVGFAKPVSAPASPSVGTAATGRGPASRAPIGTTTAEQLASAAQPAATNDAQAAKAAVAASPVAATTDGADSQPAIDPVALQQPAAVTASSPERAGDAAAAARTPAHTIAPEVGSDKWAPALGQQLLRMSASGHHTAELNLNPAGLGPLKVTLSMGDNQAQAMFVSAHESVRKAVEAALPQLRNSLSEQGITLGQTSVGAETRQPNGNDAAFAQQQQGQQQGAARQQATASYPGAGRTAAGAPAAAVAATRPAAANSRSGIDTFA